MIKMSFGVKKHIISKPTALLFHDSFEMNIFLRDRIKCCDRVV